MHTFIDDVSCRRMVLIEGTGGGKLVEIHQLRFDSWPASDSTHESPGFRMRLGSNCCFTADISACASPVVPQASRAGIF